MNIRSNKQIADIFRKFADKIENGTCAVDIENLHHIANQMIHIKRYSEDMCKDLNCSRATLSRMIIDGRIPLPRKEAGNKEYWYQDEVEEHIQEYNKKHNINK